MINRNERGRKGEMGGAGWRKRDTERDRGTRWFVIGCISVWCAGGKSCILFSASGTAEGWQRQVAFRRGSVDTNVIGSSDGGALIQKGNNTHCQRCPCLSPLFSSCKKGKKISKLKMQRVARNNRTSAWHCRAHQIRCICLRKQRCGQHVCKSMCCAF